MTRKEIEQEAEKLMRDIALVTALVRDRSAIRTPDHDAMVAHLSQWHRIAKEIWEGAKTEELEGKADRIAAWQQIGAAVEALLQGAQSVRGTAQCECHKVMTEQAAKWRAEASWLPSIWPDGRVDVVRSVLARCADDVNMALATRHPVPHIPV